MDYSKIWRVCMKKNNNKKEVNKNDLVMKDFMVNQVGLLVECTFVLFAIAAGIATIFEGEMLVIFELLMGFTLVTMAYNNLKVYKRKVFTIPYFLGATIAFFAAFQIILGF